MEHGHVDFTAVTIFGSIVLIVLIVAPLPDFQLYYGLDETGPLAIVGRDGGPIDLDGWRKAMERIPTADRHSFACRCELHAGMTRELAFGATALAAAGATPPALALRPDAARSARSVHGRVQRAEPGDFVRSAGDVDRDAAADRSVLHCARRLLHALLRAEPVRPAAGPAPQYPSPRLRAVTRSPPRASARRSGAASPSRGCRAGPTRDRRPPRARRSTPRPASRPARAGRPTA